MKKYIFVTGGVVSGLGKGINGSIAGQAAQGEGASGLGAEAGSVYKRGPGYDESVSAWRGVRHRGWSGDRSRSRPL